MLPNTASAKRFASRPVRLLRRVVSRFLPTKRYHLRLYQQIAACFVLGVFLPLLGASFIIYSINQKALRKELRNFTQQTADSLYRDLQTEMGWQERQAEAQARLFTHLWEQKGRPLNAASEAARQWLQLWPDMAGIALYHGNGERLLAQHTATTAPGKTHPENVGPWPPPELVAPCQTTPSAAPRFDVLQWPQHTGQLWLRVWWPLPAMAGGKTLPQAATGCLLLQRRFPYLETMLQDSRRTLFDGLMVVDAEGRVMAGSEVSLAQQAQLGAEEWLLFQRLEPGVSHHYSAPQLAEPAPQTTQPARAPSGTPPVAEEDDDEDEAPLEKVIVKMPKIHWGIVIESPYHVRQHYIKRARTQTLLLVLGCLLVMTVLTVFYLIGISRNFRQLIKGAKALADGNYQRRIRLITNPATPYEIIYLTGELNRMALKISAAWQQARQLNEALQQANHQLAKLDEMKSNLIDTVSHELRTPLTSIKGYTSRLLRYDDGTLDAATRLKSLKVIKQQTERLSRLVEDLLVIPDLESHRIRVFPDRIDLCALLEGCLQFIEDRDHLKIQRSWDMAACPPETIWVLADPDRLEQVLLNLLDNAVKYRSDEAAALTVRCRPALPGQAVALDVCNPCPAIAPELLPSLFEKFKRLEDGLTRTTRGSGLGLFIARGLMQAMGGNLTLAWQNGQFVATVTLLPAENPAEMDPSEEEAPPAGLAVY